MEDYYKEFTDTLLYKHLEISANVDQVKMVNDCINYCHPLLSYYITAFPTYTLHNNTHQKNILNLIARILGERLNDLTSLETALIILSAFFHDIGMVFKEDELNRIEEEAAFKSFLNQRYDARLIYEQNNSQINKELAEWYCRWTHAQRVWIYLDLCEKNGINLEWENISIKEKLGFICESHNDNTQSLLEEKYEIDFLEADLKLCAILLRIADIMDFDNSRTPKSVYEYLNLADSESDLKKSSKIEWEKHLSSNGFSFTKDASGTILKFSAGPKHPQIERNIELFLDIIEDELGKCKKIINSCSSKWRDSNVLPNSFIDRKEIRAQGYKKGNYRLSLDEHQIITLLTGKNLYNSSFEFIRELLQNAIDTSRMREFHEHSNGNNNFKAKPIQLSSWTDTEGYRWFRIDDFGMGMNETVIANHLLNKGNSYYKSSYFKLQNLLYQKQTGQSFTPISRFGIGLLSCFILGDKVEINTHSIRSEQSNNKEEKIRLSIDGLINQYIFQKEEEKHKPLKFPQIQNGWEEGYRKEIGTSIAVRINRAKDYIQFEEQLKQTLNTYLTCSTIPVYYNNSKLGIDFNIIEQPLAESEFYAFSREQKQIIEEFFNEKIDTESGIQIIPIDLSKESANPNLRGQLLFVKLVLKFPDNIRFNFDNDLRFKPKHLRFIKNHRDEITNKHVEKSIYIDLSFALGKGLEKCEEFLTCEVYGEKAYINGNINLIHNGINVPNKKRFSNNGRILSFEEKIFSRISFNTTSADHLCYGIIYLQDELIPDLSVSRNVIQNLGFQIYSSVYFATKTLNDYLPEENHFRYLDDDWETFNHNTIINDYLIKNRVWNDVGLFYFQGKKRSIEDLKIQVLQEPIKIMLNDHRKNGFLIQLKRALLEINFNLTLEVANMSEPAILVLTSINSSNNSINHQHSSLLFLPFAGSESINILSYNYHINTEHSFTKWLLKNQEFLNQEFEIYYIQLIDSILNKNISVTNQILNFFKKTIPNRDIPRNLSEDDYEFIPF